MISLHLFPDRRWRRALLFCLPLLMVGCTSIGPPTVRRDRLDYADAMAAASKREALLNIVKLRYADTPSMVTVNQLVAGYTLEERVILDRTSSRKTLTCRMTSTSVSAAPSAIALRSPTPRSRATISPE
jgi:hypothetical protein